LHPLQASNKFSLVSREVRQDLGTNIECNQGGPVFRTKTGNKSICGAHNIVKVESERVTEFGEDDNRQRRIRRTEICDRLFDIVIKDLEILLGQAADRIATLVGNNDVK